jgi:hypothetical protein
MQKRKKSNAKNKIKKTVPGKVKSFKSPLSETK